MNLTVLQRTPVFLDYVGSVLCCLVKTDIRCTTDMCVAERREALLTAAVLPPTGHDGGEDLRASGD